MSPEFFHDTAVDGALKLLPAAMDSPNARAMIIAICLQESKLQFRKQVGGPARGYAQFEAGGGVAGVLGHVATAAYAKIVCAALDVNATQTAVYAALEQNDILVAAFARLLLWTLPGNLPDKASPEAGWQQYVAAWRPGKPHRETWDMNFNQAWVLVEEAGKARALEAETLRIKEAAVGFIHSLELLQSGVKLTAPVTSLIQV